MLHRHCSRPRGATPLLHGIGLVGRPWMCLGAGTLLRVSHLPCPPGSCSPARRGRRDHSEAGTGTPGALFCIYRKKVTQTHTLSQVFSQEFVLKLGAMCHYLQIKHSENGMKKH